MRAAVLHEVGKPLEIQDVGIDKPGPQEVLIRSAACGVCHSDLHFVDGLWPCNLPIVLGHESAGIVEQVGSLVRYVKPGDHVITCLSVFCGHCEHCLSGHPARCGGRETDRTAGERPRLALAGGAGRPPVRPPVRVRRADAGARERGGEDPRRHAARSRRADRLRRDDRRRRGVPHRARRAGRDGGGDRLRRRRSLRDQRRRARRRLAHLRGRRGAVEARAGEEVRRHRRGQRSRRRPGRGDQGGDQRRRSPRARGDRLEEDGGAGVGDAASGRHRDHHRHGALRHDDRDPGASAPGRAQAPGLLDGLQPLPRRHAALRRLLSQPASCASTTCSRPTSISRASTARCRSSRPARSLAR